MDYDFKACTFEELITIAGLLEDNEKAYLTGKQLRDAIKVMLLIKSDLEECHKLCTDLGAPESGEGLNELKNRLKTLKGVKQ